MPTPNLLLPNQLTTQGQRHVTFNDAMRALDALLLGAVISRSLASPPGGPVDGDRYIVAAAPTGAWTGQAGKIAAWQGGLWVFYAPKEGWRVWVANEDTLLVWTGSAWAHQLVGSLNGGSARLVAAEEELTLASGTFVETVGAGSIQDRDIVFAVAARTTLAVTGVPSYGVGISGEATKYGGALSISLGATNIGVTGPTAFFALTPVRVTATSGTFTGGRVRVILYAIRFTAPAS